MYGRPASTVCKAVANGARSIWPWTPPPPTSAQWSSPLAGKVTAPSCRACWVRSLKAKKPAPGPQMAPATPAAATAPSSHAAALRSSRSAGTDRHGRTTVQPPGHAMKPCAPHAPTAGRSGSAGKDAMPQVLRRAHRRERPRPPDRRNPHPRRPHEPLQRLGTADIVRVG